MSQRDVKQRIDSVKNIRKITSAMQMVAAARLRRAEQRIAALRPYAGAVRRMTRRAATAAGSEATGNPILVEREDVKTVAILLVTGDRGLAGAFNSQIIRAGTRASVEAREAGQDVAFYAVGRRGISSLQFRNFELSGQLRRVHRPARLRERARDRRGPHHRVRRRGGRPRRARLQRLRLAARAGGAPRGAAPAPAGDDLLRGGRRRGRGRSARAGGRARRSSSTSPIPTRSSSG